MKRKTIRRLNSLLGQEAGISYKGESRAFQINGKLCYNEFCANIEPQCHGFAINYQRGGESRYLLLFPGRTLTYSNGTLVLR